MCIPFLLVFPSLMWKQFIGLRRALTSTPSNNFGMKRMQATNHQCLKRKSTATLLIHMLACVPPYQQSLWHHEVRQAIKHARLFFVCPPSRKCFWRVMTNSSQIIFRNRTWTFYTDRLQNPAPPCLSLSWWCPRCFYHRTVSETWHLTWITTRT